MRRAIETTGIIIISTFQFIKSIVIGNLFIVYTFILQILGHAVFRLYEYTTLNKYLYDKLLL